MSRSAVEHNPVTACGQRRQPGRLVVSNVVSFAWVRGRPPSPICHSQASSRMVVNPGERWPTYWKACWQRRAGRLAASTTSLVSAAEVDGESGGGQQGQACLVVGGLDGRDRINADSFVGGMQALICNAESGGRLNAETAEVVPDVRRSGDLRRGRQADLVRGGEQCGLQG